MTYKISRSEFFQDAELQGGMYSVEYVVTDNWNIHFNVLLNPDPSMVKSEKTLVGSTLCTREAKWEGFEMIEGSEEAFEDFVRRARFAGIEFGKQAIVEYKEALIISEMLGKAIRDDHLNR